MSKHHPPRPHSPEPHASKARSSRPRSSRHSRAALLIAGSILLASGCGQPDHVDVSLTRTVRHADPSRPGATHTDRFGTSSAPSGGSAAGERSISELLRERLTWDTPAGWEELPAGGMRIASLRPAGHPDADCSLIVLEGSGGGLEGNVNRWRSQLGLAPFDQAAIAVLPTMNLLGGAGVLVDFDGTYTGMGGPEREDWNLRGVILNEESFTIFLKMTAPAAVAEAERAAFDAFCASLRMKGQPAQAVASPPSAKLNYTTPEGWTDVGAKSMRAVNLTVGGAQCYVIVLGGEAGGLLGNLNRWRGEVGLPPIGEQDVADLDHISILGQEAALLDVRGDYKGAGEASGSDYHVFGVALIRPTSSVFVKMVGPEAEVANLRPAFIEFVASLEEV